MKFKKNNNGFTLIELLITIVIIVSILLISLVSLTETSDRKKTDAYNEVVKTIESAAEDYMIANEYMFENNYNDRIPLKYLINEGYLNKVINPLTGKAFNECNYVSVDTVSKKIIGFSEGTGNCELTNRKIINPSANIDNSSIDFKFMCGGSVAKKTKTGWYNEEYLKPCDNKPILEVTIKIDKDSNIKNIYSCHGKKDCEPTLLENVTAVHDDNMTIYKIDDTNFQEDTPSKYAVYKVVDDKGELKPSLEIKIDTKKPVLAVNLYKFNNNEKTPSNTTGLATYTSSTWSNKNIYTTANASDDTSGIETIGYKAEGTTTNDSVVKTNAKILTRNIKANGKSTIVYETCDKAINCTKGAVNNIWVDKVKPTLTVGLYKYANNETKPSSETGLSSYSNNTWSNKYIYTKANATDSYSGIDSYKYTTTGATINQANKLGKTRSIEKDGTSKIKYEVCDKVGNCTTSDEKTIKIDTMPPEVAITLYNDKDNNIASGTRVHYKNLYYKITASDIKKEDSRSTIDYIKYFIKEGIGEADKTLSNYKNEVSSGFEDKLLSFAGKKTVYAVAVDKAGNKDFARVIGIVDNDKVKVDQLNQACNFTLSLQTLYEHENGQLDKGYEYAVWKVANTSDTENKQSDNVKDICGDAPPSNATFEKVNGNETAQIKILTKANPKKYYCFAVRPLKTKTKYRPDKYNDLKWTVQRKHAKSTSCN